MKDSGDLETRWQPLIVNGKVIPGTVHREMPPQTNLLDTDLYRDIKIMNPVLASYIETCLARIEAGKKFSS